ncbi:MAG: FAD-binding protein, partial [Candidatus Methanomethylicota archaeon]
MTSSEAIEELRKVFGSRLLTEEDVLEPYMEDESYIRAKPSAAVIPENVEEVEELVKIAIKYRMPLTARGSGTSLSGGAVPVEGGVVVDFRRMNRILEVYPDDMQVLAEPGVIYDDLNAHLAKYNLFLPPNPATGDQCTIGGMVAENAAGPRSFKYGTTRNWVLGLEVVTSALGKIWVGSRTKKWVSGYDLVRLFVG